MDILRIPAIIIDVLTITFNVSVMTTNILSN